MEFDTSKLTDEQVSKVNEFINNMVEENKATKWWIIATYSPFVNIQEYNQFGPCYTVAPQQDSYSRSNPPLKSDFNSKEEAAEWLSKYLSEDRLYSLACTELDMLKNSISVIQSKIKNHNHVTEEDWKDCFYAFNSSRLHGILKDVTEEGSK